MANPTPTSAANGAAPRLDAPNYVESLVRHMQQPQAIDQAGIPMLVAPHSMDLHVLEALLPKPTRRRASPAFAAIDSFIAYVASVKGPNSRIYADADYAKGALTVCAVINDDGPAEADAGWRDHRPTYVAEQSVEWRRWMSNNKKVMEQVEFAAFIEDNIDVVVGGTDEGGRSAPSGAEMLAMALSLEATQDSSFRSQVRLQSGSYELSAVAKDNAETAEKMVVFSRFALVLRPFQHQQAYRVWARLRYRIRDARATFWYELERPDLVVEDAVKGIVASLKNRPAGDGTAAVDAATPALGLPVLLGSNLTRSEVAATTSSIGRHGA